jgi:hypothetical protein
MSDGTSRLGNALYGREPTASEYVGGSEAKILHHAADHIILDKLKIKNRDEENKIAMEIIEKANNSNDELLTMVAQQKDTLNLLKRENTQVIAELDNWIETARQNQQNADYYRHLVIQCGEGIGDMAYISDDGTVQHDVLCAKVPELVIKLRLQVSHANNDIEDLRDRLNNGIRYDEKQNQYIVVWTQRELDQAKIEAEKLSKFFNPIEPKQVKDEL